MNGINKLFLESLKNRYDVSYLAVFGSYAHDVQDEDSDLDLLIDFHREMGLLEFIGIEHNLSDELGIKVDLVTPSALSPYLKNKILNDAVVIFDERNKR